jgi:two-component system, NarL family, nitrate/nitrite response regulator NarL
MLLMDHRQSTSNPPAVTSVSTNRARTVRVGLVSHISLERQGLKMVLESIGFDVVFEASELGTVVSAFADNTPPEIFLIDVPVDIEPGQWVGALGELRHRYRDSRIALLADQPTAAWWSVCWHTDIDAYLSKSNGAAVLKRQLDLVLAGERMFPFDVIQSSTAAWAAIWRGSAAPNALSAVDMQILRYLVTGHSNKLIASRLKIRESTVKARMKSVYLKIGAANRTQAAIWALNHGIKPDDMGG